jgi:endonuclease/exonuclease/phosphatase family metal-dependent hydrolase
MWGTNEPLEARLELARSQLAALDLDAVCVQEVRPLAGGDKRTTADEIADHLDFAVAYRVATRWDDGEEGLAILSRHDILDVQSTELPERRSEVGRILLSARIDHPVAPLWIHTTHHHYRLDDGMARERQVLAVDRAIAEIGENPQILCGDFNAVPDADEIRFLCGLTTLGGRRVHYQDAWDRLHPGEPGITWSGDNRHTEPLRFLDVGRRIDYVFVTSRRKDGRGRIVDCQVVLDNRDADGNCASDHFGVLADVVVAPATR